MEQASRLFAQARGLCHLGLFSYQILPAEDADREGDVRIIDESGEDYLYPAEWFVAIDIPEEVEASLLQPS